MSSLTDVQIAIAIAALAIYSHLTHPEMLPGILVACMAVYYLSTSEKEA